MNPSTYNLDLSQTTMAGTGRVSLAMDAAALNEWSVRSSFPPSIKSSQRYFWTREWQIGEREAETDYRAGQMRRFNDFESMARWLLSTEDDDD